MLSPKKQLPKGDLIKKINNQYGSLKKLKDEFNQIASERFGSGWVWLILLKNGNLKIDEVINQFHTINEAKLSTKVLECVLNKFDGITGIIDQSKPNKCVIFNWAP